MKSAIEMEKLEQILTDLKKEKKNFKKRNDKILPRKLNIQKTVKIMRPT